jgi:hypothetical protein
MDGVRGACQGTRGGECANRFRERPSEGGERKRRDRRGSENERAGLGLARY